MLPRWHGFAAGVQSCPEGQELQAPAKQTWFWPQDVPSVFAEPRSVQTARPVAHEFAPAWQGKPEGSHAVPGVQAPHAPPLQYRLEPQADPSTKACPLSLHNWVPVEQSVSPLWQGFAPSQIAPLTQPTQDPAWQTWSWPQKVPSAIVSLPATQLGVPPVQATVPWRHGSDGGRQLWPPTQTAMHAPAEQIWFGPHEMPSSTFPADEQMGDPAAQLTCPIWQGLGRLHRAPATQDGGGPASGGETVTPSFASEMASATCCPAPTKTLAATARV